MIIIKESNPKAVSTAIEALKNDGVICFATETIYALSCNAFSDKAVKKLYEIKKRDTSKPIAIFANNLDMAKRFLHFNEIEERVARKFMPGMITLILNKISNTKLSNYLNVDDNLGLRIPDHQFCLKLLTKFNQPIAATSANFSKQALNFCDNKVDLIIDGGICEHKIASTVLRVENGIKIVRKGLITQRELNLCKI
ncbi:MAG: tRNA threonylcarbamoyl adenosine modification protein (Sua5/YciO/YrdC/YwlC family) [Rickettsiales bacterium]|jgi:tRNA threonylcarbamoyl adenosine modification protein (Sua5/YciO/YrdC/YwlC family)